MKLMNSVKPNSLRRTLKWLVIIVIVMFGYTFAMVPLYNVICKATGLNGKTSNTAYSSAQMVDTSRTITVEFVATNNAYLPWDFYPKINKVHVHPGENTLLAFHAKNNSPHTMTVQAIPSVAPGYVAKYLKKTECFCFTQQTFKSGEERDMPLLFHIDPDIPRSVEVLSLSYTLFDASHYKPRYNLARVSTGRIR